MDTPINADLFLMQTAPYVITTGVCGGDHLHVVGGFVSDVPPGEDEENVWINGVTGEVLRGQSNLAFSLN